MLVPLMVLAILSVVGGWIGMPHALGGGDRFDISSIPVSRRAYPSSRSHRDGPAANPDTDPPPLKAPRANGPHSLLCPGRPARLFLAVPLYCASRSCRGDGCKHGSRLPLICKKYWVDEIYGLLIVEPLLIISRCHSVGRFDRGASVDGNRACRRTQGSGRCSPHSVRKHSLLRRLAGLAPPSSCCSSYFRLWTHRIWGPGKER